MLQGRPSGSLAPRRPFLVVLLALLVLGGCRQSADPPPPVVPPSAAAAGDDEPAAAPPTAAELAPVLSTTGTSEGLPTRLVIELARRIAGPERNGQELDDGTSLELTPSVEGTLRQESPTTLVFEPASGFEPSTHYTARLTAVETPNGLVSAPDQGWAHEFTTPDFWFVRFDAVSVDVEKSTALLALTFSGGVRPKDVARQATLALLPEDGRGKATPLKVLRQRHWNGNAQVVRLLVKGDGLRPGRSVKLALSKGVSLGGRGEHVAPATVATATLPKEPPVVIRDVYRQEGINGFHVEIVCHDEAVHESRWYWDSERGRGHSELSSRCLPREEDAAEGIHFDPPVDFTLSPAPGGFRLLGDFPRGSYTVRFDAGLRSQDGGVLSAMEERSFTVPARTPKVSFTSRGRYLPRSEWGSLAVRHLNVSEVDLAVRHVPPRNLIFWLGERSEPATTRTSDLIGKTTRPVRGETDVLTTTHLDLRELVPNDLRGLVELELSGGDDRDAVRFLLTDLQLVAKRIMVERDGEKTEAVRTWVLDMTTLAPAADVSLELVAPSGRLLDGCVTDRNGECELVPPTDALEPTPPLAVIARKGDDLTYLKFAELRTEVQEQHVFGEPYASEQLYRVAVHPERGVYRPGETVHLTLFVRDDQHVAPPAGLPVVVHVHDARGQEVRRHVLTTDATGLLTQDIELADFAPTGRWLVRARVAEREVGQARFQVEEFVPERMEVTSTIEGASRMGEPVPVDVKARYLFGGVPDGHRVELTCTLEPGGFAPKENASFHYGTWHSDDQPPRSLDLGNADGLLDEDGAVTLQCPGGETHGGFRGTATLVARAAVFESGSGRTTVGTTTTPVHPAPFYLGLSSGTEKVRAGEQLTVNGVVVDWEGRRTDGGPAEVKATLLRLEREYGHRLDPVTGRWSYRQFRRPVVAVQETIPVADGRFQLSWTPERDGVGWVVRVEADSARTDLELEGRGGWWWGPSVSSADRTPRPDRPAWLDLKTPETARVGEPFTVRFDAPHAGRVLLTAETDELWASEWRDVEAGEVSWTVTAPELQPNFYVTALLLKPPHLDSPKSFLPDRAFGVSSIELEPTELMHSLELDVPDEVRSNSPLMITLDLGPTSGPTKATVAAVDEGILSLTQHESPNPFPSILTRRALGVETFETIGWTFLRPPAGPSSTVGGGGDGSMDRVEVVEPVALWSGVVDVPASGKVDVTLDVPQYRGALRVMALTADAKRMGHASRRVIVRDPVVLQVTLPRFLIKDDALDVPVFVTNVSGEPREVEVTLTAEAIAGAGGTPAPIVSPVEVVSRDAKTLTLADGESGTSLFWVRVRGSSGAARLTATIRSGDLVSVEERKVPLLPAGPRTRLRQRIELEEGRTPLTKHLTGWEPGSERSTFWVTGNPHADVLSQAEELLRYPHGCLEQTTSQLRPLLFVSSLLPQVDAELVADGSVDDRVAHGIDRILSMQTPSGGFAYWPGGSSPTHWATAYAVHALLDARKQRYPVPQDRLDEALDWMEDRITHHYERGGRTRNDWYSRDAEPYLHHVLALAGRPRKARIEKLLAEDSGRRDGQVHENRYLLQAALHLAGDRRHDAALRKPKLTAEGSRAHRHSWTFYSRLRHRGLALSTHVDLFGRDAQGEQMADELAALLRSDPDRRLTTQDMAWVVSGLGKLLAEGADDFEPPRLLAGDAELASSPPPPGRPTNERSWSLLAASERDDLVLDLPSKGDGTLWLILSSEGVRTDGELVVGGSSLKVERVFLDGAGEPVSFEDGEHSLGDLVNVQLTITNTTEQRLANLALVDRLPAGWEIENPRLGRGGSLDWIDGDALWNADHLDLRDDRLAVFGHLNPKESKRVVYTVRAVTAGRFTIPPVEVEAMYDPGVWARQAGFPLTISGPWTPVAQ
ncbi:MAG: MG2 domain-containing protein [Acidobacteriota bacterium]